MKKVLLLIIILISSLDAYTQTVVWTKKYQWDNLSTITAIQKTDEGYLAKGIISSRGLRYYGESYPKPVLIRLDENGDSIQTIDLDGFEHIIISNKALKKCPDGDYFTALNVEDTLGYKAIRLFKISPIGEIRWYLDYSDTLNWLVKDMCVLPDGSAVLIGSKDAEPAALYHGFAIKVDKDGNEKWRQIYTPSIYTCPYFISAFSNSAMEIQNGFLLSGGAGSSIWAVWLDSLGNIKAERKYWKDPGNSALIFAGLIPLPDGTYIAWGSNSIFNAYKWFVGKYDSRGVKIWGHAEAGCCRSLQVNNIGQVLLEYDYGQGGAWFRKINPDSSIAGSVQLTANARQETAFNAVAWMGGDSAVFAGYQNNPVFPGYPDFYFVKMAGVGSPVSVKPSIVSEPLHLLPYPNPAKESFSLNSRVAGELVVYNTSGQSISVHRYEPGDKADISGLAPGLYLYRFSSSVGVSAGKIVKE
ncbi:MAG: T9SS type A sorting domain-containing protein [Bacteroidota bacterium]